MKNNTKCVLDPDKPCTDCGECDRCDYDKTKICDNCGKCLGLDADSRAILITEVQTPKG
ncbi:MAG: hypothetical protein LUG52_08880 [Clostridia bacterium]|nr:hypothetical protein [Clostridia bacterium]